MIETVWLSSSRMTVTAMARVVAREVEVEVVGVAVEVVVVVVLFLSREQFPVSVQVPLSRPIFSEVSEGHRHHPHPVQL